jgi:HEAT repeat protein
MDVEKLAAIVEEMGLQHAYPGYDVRSLKMGLPQEVIKAPGKIFHAALKHDNPLVRLAALRWFQEKPGIARAFANSIAECTGDPDEWVRAETCLALERISEVDEKAAVRIADLLKDESVMVRKAAAKALGKLGCQAQPVIDALMKATEDSDHQVRWKAQKALRQLGAFVA